MPIDAMEKLETRAVKYAFEVSIDAPVEKVWNLLTTEISAWWPEHFHSSPDTKQFRLEPKVGGRLYEDFGDDAGVLWAHVVHLQPLQRIQLRGDLFPDYGGPGSFILSLALEPSDSGCKLKVDDALFGYISDESVESLEGGWKELFGEHLKRVAES